MRFAHLLRYFSAAVLAAGTVHAQDKAAIQQKLESVYALTQPTAALDDIVTAGAILVLQKSDLMLGPTGDSTVYSNTYKSGKIEPSSEAKTKNALSKFGHNPFGGLIPGGSTAATADSYSGSALRTYVKGEKMWVTNIELKMEKKDEPEVVFTLFTDAVKDVRYRGTLKIPYPKGATDDQVGKLVGEVFTVQPQDSDQKQASGNGQQQAAPAQPAPAGAQAAVPPVAAPPAPAAPAEPAASAPLPDIPPPPPPADAPVAPPPTVTIGQTPDQVIAILGQPQKIVKLPKKETYFYKDLKVIFVNGKVSDVE